MKNKNNNIDNQKISFFPKVFLPPPLKEKHNLLENYNIIQYNGVTMPRIFLFNPFFINNFIPLIMKNGFNRCKKINNSSKEPELIIELNEKENKKPEICNEYLNWIKKANMNELNLYEMKDNVNNYNLIEQDKHWNFVKSIDFIKNIENLSLQRMLNNNKGENFNHI